MFDDLALVRAMSAAHSLLVRTVYNWLNANQLAESAPVKKEYAPTV